MIYLDTSAFIKLYFLEAGSEQVDQYVTSQDDPLPVWDILEAEFANACRLKALWGDIAAEEADRQIALFVQRLRRGQYYVPEVDRHAMMEAFRDLSRHTPTVGCRTMDILHVACALQLAPARFVSFDERQRALAKHAALTVVP
ncbi:MAG: type II toxin-antitoxin system VapC family toxin [Kiritimatiellae bacterium]|nr:type II toxin-antitoxin system VapC family toxin [Kiritimatiellia bacterium]